jgi:hypothetical protein
MFRYFLAFVSLSGICFALYSCGINKQRISINGYFIHPDGMINNGTPLHAYIFENDLSNVPFQNFLATHYKTKNLFNKTITVSTNGFTVTLIFYDFDEFEKYFGSQNFESANQETAPHKMGNANKFIAISAVNTNSEDCLNKNSLINKVATDYISNLKKQYLLSNGRSQK